MACLNRSQQTPLNKYWWCACPILVACLPLQPFNTAFVTVSVQFANVGGPQLCQRRPGHTDKQSRSVTKRPRAALLLLCGGHCRHVGMHPAVPASPSYSAAQPGTRARPSGRRQSVRCCAACALCVLYPVSHMILFHTVGCAWLYIMPTRRPGDCCSYVACIAEWRLCMCCLVKCVVMLGLRCLFSTSMSPRVAKVKFVPVVLCEPIA